MSDPAQPDVPADETASDEGFEDKQRLLDRFRGTGVGVEDPNIVGNVGPTDVPPGADPDSIDLPPGLAPDPDPAGGAADGDQDDEGLAPGRDPETTPPGA